MPKFLTNKGVSVQPHHKIALAFLITILSMEMIIGNITARSTPESARTNPTRRWIPQYDCPIGQILSKGSQKTCVYIHCTPVPNDRSENEGDCFKYRDATNVPVDNANPLVSHYGFGCFEDICLAYEDPDLDEFPAEHEKDCRDTVDGDVDGLTDMDDTEDCVS